MDTSELHLTALISGDSSRFITDTTSPWHSCTLTRGPSGLLAGPCPSLTGYGQKTPPQKIMEHQDEAVGLWGRQQAPGPSAAPGPSIRASCQQGAGVETTQLGSSSSCGVHCISWTGLVEPSLCPQKHRPPGSSLEMSEGTVN